MAVYLDAVPQYDLEKIEAAVERGIKEFGVDLSGARTAVIKPNLVQARLPESGIITHPVVIEAIINVLADHGVRQITIAEAPALGVAANKAFQVGGYTDLAARKHVKLIDLMEAPRTQVHMGYGYKDVPNVYDEASLSSYHCGYLSIPNVILDSDLYINVPKLKTHNRTTVSVTMKNQWGLLGFKDRQMYHRIGLHEPISQLARCVQPNLTVVDGILGLEGNGPILGSPKPVGALVVGQNMVETDIVSSMLMGQDPRKIIHIRQAIEAGVGNWDYTVLGERIEDLATNFAPAPQDVKRKHNLFVWRNHRACHLDDDAFVHAAKIAKKNPKYWMFFVKLGYYTLFKRLDIVRGRGSTMPEIKKGQRVIVSGECARELMENYEELPKNVIFIPGCPPEAKDIIKAVIRM